MRGVGLTAVLLLAACDGEYEVVVHLPGDASRAETVEVAVIGTCDGVPALGDPPEAIRLARASDGEPPALGSLPPGRYGLYGRAWDSSCSLYAAGCAPVRVAAGGEGTLEVFLVEIPPRGCDDGTRCTDGACVPVEADGGPYDAGVVDGGYPPCEDGPAVVATAAQPVEALAVAADTDGRYLYALDFAENVVVLDATSPLEPEAVHVELAGAGANGLTIDGELLFVFEQGRVRFASTDATPGFYGDLVLSGDPYSAAVLADTFALVAIGAGGLEMVFTGAHYPRVETTLPTAGFARQVVGASPFAFVADGEAGLTVVNASDPASPEITTTLPLNSVALRVARSPTALFVGTEDALLAMDIRNPAEPELLGQVALPSAPVSMATAGEFVMVGTFEPEVHFIHASDLESLTLVWTAPVDAPALAIAPFGGFAALALGEAGLAILDLACYRPDA